MNRFKLRKKIDLAIPTTGLILSLFGLVMVLSASQINAAEQFGNAYYFFIRQLISWCLGLAAFFYYLRIPLDKLYEQRSKYLLVTIFLLVFVLIFSPRIAYVHRWIDLGFFRFQPAEFAKLFLVIYFAGWFAAKGDQVRNLMKGFLPFLAILVTIIGLVILEPDMGTMLVILLLSLVMYFIARASLVHYFALVVLGFVALVGLIYIAPYRAQRLETFLNHSSESSDVLGSGYHAQQAMIAIGSGGWWGAGFGQGTSKYSYLPEAQTDSIFAVIAEELGFVRSTLVIFAYLFIGWRGFYIVRHANSRFVQLLAVGLSTAIISQALLNIGGMLNLIPLTGVPLPFVSYGGSSLIICLAMIGLLTNISREVE